MFFVLCFQKTRTTLDQKIDKIRKKRKAEVCSPCVLRVSAGVCSPCLRFCNVLQEKSAQTEAAGGSAEKMEDEDEEEDTKPAAGELDGDDEEEQEEEEEEDEEEEDEFDSGDEEILTKSGESGGFYFEVQAGSS